MFNTIKKRPQIFKRLVGVSLDIFEKMVVVVEKTEEKRLNGETRGRNEQLVLKIKFYLPCCIGEHTQHICIDERYCEFLNQMHKGKVSRLRIFCLTVDYLVFQKRCYFKKQWILLFIVDATEVQRDRPVKKQKECYSGKKKMHTLKAQIIITKEGKILNISFAKGKVHDKKLYDTSNIMIHPKTKKQGDSGYQGVQKTMSNVEIPYKSSKKNKLSKEQKHDHHELSTQRIKVENLIREVKIFDIFDETYRNKGKRFGLRFNLVCGIINRMKGFYILKYTAINTDKNVNHLFRKRSIVIGHNYLPFGVHPRIVPRFFCPI